MKNLKLLTKINSFKEISIITNVLSGKPGKVLILLLPILMIQCLPQISETGFRFRKKPDFNIQLELVGKKSTQNCNQKNNYSYTIDWTLKNASSCRIKCNSISLSGQSYSCKTISDNLKDKEWEIGENKDVQFQCNYSGTKIEECKKGFEYSSSIVCSCTEDEVERLELKAEQEGLILDNKYREITRGK